MSGVRRKTKYRKGVEEDVLHSLPEPKEGESIVRMVGPRGGNLVEVEAVDGSRALCRLPNRFRKVVWIMRGTLLIVETSTESYSTAAGEDGKVKYIVSHVIFTEEQVKNLRKKGLLPAVFDGRLEDTTQRDGEDDDLLQANRNRRPVMDEESSSDDSSDSDEDKSKTSDLSDDKQDSDEDGSEEGEEDEDDEE